ncbi:MAG: hypothetical protein C4308_03745 [Chitinophagaceae bacterium]
MKKFLMMIIAAALTATTIGQVNGEKLSGSISKGRFVLNDVVVSNGWAIAPLQNLLGNTERIKDGANRTHSYDKLGLVLYEKIKK